MSRTTSTAVILVSTRLTHSRPTPVGSRRGARLGSLRLLVVVGAVLVLPSCNETRTAASLDADASTDGGAAPDRDAEVSGDAESWDDGIDGQPRPTDADTAEHDASCTVEYALRNYEGGTMPLEWDLTPRGREEFGRGMTVFVVNSGMCAFEVLSVSLDADADAAEWFELDARLDTREELAVPTLLGPGERFRLDVEFQGYMPYDTEYVATLVISIAELEQPIEILFRGMRVR